MSTSRRNSRELALQVLFQLEFTSQKDLSAALDNFRRAYTAPEDVWGYALRLLEYLQGHKDEIDQLIQSQTAHWRLERLALVDLNILRLAASEMRIADEEVPPAVAINEAIELAKKYGTSESAKFVNGVLDQIRRQLD